jgi:hypothetical protein
MKAPRVFLMVVAIALAGIGPALTDAADMTAASLYPKAVDPLEAATGGKVLEIRFVAQKGHERNVSKFERFFCVGRRPRRG